MIDMTQRWAPVHSNQTAPTNDTSSLRTLMVVVADYCGVGVVINYLRRWTDGFDKQIDRLVSI